MTLGYGEGQVTTLLGRGRAGKSFTGRAGMLGKVTIVADPRLELLAGAGAGEGGREQDDRVEGESNVGQGGGGVDRTVYRGRGGWQGAG